MTGHNHAFNGICGDYTIVSTAGELDERHSLGVAHNAISYI